MTDRQDLAKRLADFGARHRMQFGRTPDNDLLQEASKFIAEEPEAQPEAAPKTTTKRTPKKKA